MAVGESAAAAAVGLSASRLRFAFSALSCASSFACSSRLTEALSMSPSIRGKKTSL